MTVLAAFLLATGIAAAPAARAAEGAARTRHLPPLVQGELGKGLHVEPRPIGRDPAEVPETVLGKFVLTEFQTPYDMLRRAEITYEGPFGYVMSGLFRADESGEHAFLARINVGDSGGFCAVRMMLGNDVLFTGSNGARRASFTVVGSGQAHLDPGLVPLTLWLACQGKSYEGTSIEILIRDPGDSQFSIAEPTRLLHRRYER